MKIIKNIFKTLLIIILIPIILIIEIILGLLYAVDVIIKSFKYTWIPYSDKYIDVDYIEETEHKIYKG